MTNPGYSPVQKLSLSDFCNQADEYKVRFQLGEGFHQDIKLHQYEDFIYMMNFIKIMNFISMKIFINMMN